MITQHGFKNEISKNIQKKDDQMIISLKLLYA
jgi:hypothetical protein